MLGRQRPVGTDRGELGFRLLHRLDRLRQQLGDLLERRIPLNELAVQTREQPFDLLAQPRLRQPDDRRALAQLGRRIVPPIALHVERRRDDLPLLLRERLDLTAGSAAATTASAAVRLRLAEVPAERTDAQEIQVARRLLALPRRVVDRARVVRHRVARLDAELLEVEGVAGGHLGQPVAAAEQLDGLLGAAVHRVDELEVANAEVVLGLRLDVHLFDRRRRRVAAGFRERHGRRLIRQHVDRVLRRRGRALLARSLELDAVETVARPP